MSAPDAPTAGAGQAGRLSRREFLRVGAGGLIVSAAGLARARAQARPDDILVGLIGVGVQGRVLIEAALNIPGVRFKAVCDIWEYSRQYGQRYLKKQGIEVNAYEDHREMLDKEPDLDAVIVASPDFWHAPHTIDSLRAGRHVYCEKMMSHTAAGARSMVAAMRETGKLLQIGHQRRSNPRYRHVRENLIEKAKLIGRITHANAQWNRAAAADLGWPAQFAIPPATLEKYGYRNMHQFRNWRWFRALGGGPMSDLGAHQVDVYNWFFGGPARTVIAGGGNEYYTEREWFDNVMAIYTYDTPAGAVRAFYQVLTTTSAGGGYFEQVMGIDGSIKISENPRITRVYREAHAPEWDEWVARQFLKKAGGGAPAPKAGGVTDARETADLVSYDITATLDKPLHQPHLENFFNAIRAGEPLNCPGDEAFASEAVIFKTNEAVESKRMIEIPPEACRA